MAQKKIRFLFIPMLLISTAFCGVLQASSPQKWDTKFINQTFEKAGSYVDNSKNECAKFVNRLFALRFKKQIWGHAWDTPLKKENQKYLQLTWQVDPKKINQHNWVDTTADRIEMFRALYQHAEKSPTGFGLAGFAYRFSFAYEQIQKGSLRQTHIAFISAKKLFQVENNSISTKSVQELLEEKVGTIHDFEADFVNQRLNKYKNFAEKRIDLQSPIKPNQSFFYYDFPLEEQFKYPRQENLLLAFLRKHRNNKVSALLRPVSWTNILPSVWEE